MPVKKTGLACPLCDHDQVTSHLLENAPSVLGVYCETGNLKHQWLDTTELRMMQPRKLDLPKPAPVTQQNRTALTVNVPDRLAADLRDKYGDTLNENLVSLLQYGTQPDFLILTTEDLSRIEERTGSRPASGAELFGHLFQMGEQIQEQKDQIKRMERSSKIRQGGSGVTIDLGVWLPKAAGKADEANMATDEFLETYLRNSLENDWIMV